jgi:hypothetical protein
MAILKKDITDIQRRKPPAKPTKLADGGGLYLYITKTGSLLWRYDYRRKADGKRKTMSFGEYGDTLISIPHGNDIRPHVPRLRTAVTLRPPSKSRPSVPTHSATLPMLG